MGLSAGWIRQRNGDHECLEALAYLAEKAPRYPGGRFMPPFTARAKPEKPKSFLAATFRVRSSRGSRRAYIGRIEWCDASDHGTIDASDERDRATGFAKSVLTARHSGSFIVTAGRTRHVLDIWLESFGPSMTQMGYTLQPCLSSFGVDFIIIRRGKRSWCLIYYETMYGIDVKDGMEFVTFAGESHVTSVSLCQNLYHATDAVSRWLQREFGVAMHHTIGITALACARESLERSYQKWRPVPLLVAMERVGVGYRGGMTYARRYRGPTWRVDVNRQYTHALKSALPLRVTFGRYVDDEVTPHGIYMCRVSLNGDVPYPLGIWRGPQAGFEYARPRRGEFVCVMHTNEFAGVRAIGGDIRPDWGYHFTATFTLARYAKRLQAIVDTYGKDSPEGRFSKFLGNYVYGKFAQRPDRMEMLFSADKPDKSWYPYWDNEGKAWEEIWERRTVRHTFSQHVDIAGAITAAARSQTAQMWAYFNVLGIRVIRCHTDSLTVDMDPSPYLSLSESSIGKWRLESADPDAIVVGPNAYFDQGEAHIAGVSNPTYEMVDRMLDGHVVAISQEQNAPRRGWRREAAVRAKELRATGD